MPEDASATTDHALIELNATDHPPDPGVKGPVELYLQVFKDPKGKGWRYRSVSRAGDELDVSKVFDGPGAARKAAAAEARRSDVTTQVETLDNTATGPRPA